VGSKSLDDLLGGGVCIEAITEILRESNTGNTQISHTLSVMVQIGRHRGGLDGKAIYMMLVRSIEIVITVRGKL
jgi:DNA repair protein RadA